MDRFQDATPGSRKLAFNPLAKMIRAIIFDLDGTLADTEPLHFEAFAAILRPLGIELSRHDYFNCLIGYNDHDCFATVLREQRKSFDEARLAELIEKKAAVYQATIAHRDVMYPGAANFVRRCAERFPLIVATGTLHAEAQMILARANIRDLFLDIIAAEDVTHGKPEPDGFLTALGRLGFILRPHPSITGDECLVIEDTPAGIKAAHRAGMRALAVCQTVPAGDLSAADLVRPSLRETDLDEILQILSAKT
jgi:beta-phosphoglucomutase